MVGVDGTQGYGVGVGALGLRLADGCAHLRDGAGDGRFLDGQPDMEKPIEARHTLNEAMIDEFLQSQPFTEIGVLA
jgi:hypothetical protein